MMAAHKPVADQGVAMAVFPAWAPVVVIPCLVLVGATTELLSFIVRMTVVTNLLNACWGVASCAIWFLRHDYRRAKAWALVTFVAVLATVTWVIIYPSLFFAARN
jgi:hypothetical protein